MVLRNLRNAINGRFLYHYSNHSYMMRQKAYVLVYSSLFFIALSLFTIVIILFTKPFTDIIPLTALNIFNIVYFTTALYLLSTNRYNASANIIVLCGCLCCFGGFLIRYESLVSTGTNSFMYFFFMILGVATFFCARRILAIVSIVVLCFVNGFYLSAYSRVASGFVNQYTSNWINVVFSLLVFTVVMYIISDIMNRSLLLTEKELGRNKELSSNLEAIVHERTRELERERNKLKKRNEMMEHEIALARKIQEQLIPSVYPLASLHSLYKPMEQVGGDFMDFIPLDDPDACGIFISDVSGHGVPAAFITSMIKTTILQAGRRVNDPAVLLTYINQVLQSQTAGNFITAFYGIYNKKNHSFLYSNAGHPQPYVISDSRIAQLQGGKNTAIAMFPNKLLANKNKRYINYEEVLPSRTKLLLYTDGLIEARPVNDSDMFFEYSSMSGIFAENKHLPCDRFISSLYDRLVDFRGSDSFDDDVCIICLDVN